MVSEEKIKQVEELTQEAAGSGAVVFSDYSGLTVAEMTELRKRLAEIGADFRIVKNTLLKRSLEKANLGLEEELTGPTAAMFSRSADPIESVKVLASFLKEKAKGEIRSGFFEKAKMAATEFLSLAALPSKAALQARFISLIISPVYKLAYILSNSQKKLVLVLGQISKSKGGVDNG